MKCSRCKGIKKDFNYAMCRKCRKYHRELKRKWRKEHPGEDAKIAKRYRQRNPEKVRASRKKYVEANPDIIKQAQLTRDKNKHAEIRRKRRRIKMQAKGSFTQKEFLKLCEIFDYKCLSCRKKFEIGGIYGLVADHIKPLSRGGLDYIFNIQCLCGTCNRKKLAKNIDYRPFIPKFVEDKYEFFNA